MKGSKDINDQLTIGYVGELFYAIKPNMIN